MATATQKPGAAKRLTRRGREAGAPVPMQFRMFEDNGGEYHWTIVAGDGTTLARSGGFASYDDAEEAARNLRDGAASGRFERRAAGASPADHSERRVARRDASDAERWLDEGGSFSSEAVAKWQLAR